MDQSNVPNDLIEAAEAAVGDSEWIEADPGIRAVLAAVLPLYEQQVRERIATALERISDDCGRRAGEYQDERSPGLEFEEGAYWNAARLIREGKEQKDSDG